MANLTLDHIKTIVQSVLAGATRYKPNLSVTDPDDPRYVVGAEGVANKVAKAQAAASTAQTAADAAQTAADAAQTRADSAVELFCNFAAYDTQLEFQADESTSCTTNIYTGDYSYLRDFDGFMVINKGSMLEKWIKMTKTEYGGRIKFRGNYPGHSFGNYNVYVTTRDNARLEETAPLYLEKQGICAMVESQVTFVLGKKQQISEDLVPATIQRVGNPLTLTSPSGAKYTLSVDDDGNLSTTEVTDS